MSTGMKLNSMEDLENKAAKTNVLYIIAVVLGVIMGAMAGYGMVMLVVIFVIVAWILQGEYLKWKIRDFRKMSFWVSSSLKVEDIVQESSRFAEQGIQVIHENGQLNFKHDSIIYSYNKTSKETFNLEWRYTLGKALFSFAYVSDYKKVRQDTAFIVYTIQHIKAE